MAMLPDVKAKFGEDAAVETEQAERISEEDWNSMVTTDENGVAMLDITNPVFSEIIDEVVVAVVNGQKLTPRQQSILDILERRDTDFAKEIMDDIDSEKATRAASPTTLATPGRNAKIAQEQRLRENAQPVIDEINRQYEADVEVIANEASLLDDPSTPTPEMEAMLEQLSNEREIALERVEQTIQDALNFVPTGRNKETHKTLEKLDNFIENLIEKLKAANKEHKTEFIDNFNMSAKEIQDLFDEFNTLATRDALSDTEMDRVVELKDLMDSLGLVEGRLSEEDSTSIRLSDVLEVRAGLEKELFQNVEEFTDMSEAEFNQVTTDSPTEEFSHRGRGGDPSVLNNYDFATFTATKDGTVSISNITPGYLARALAVDNDVLISIEGSEFTVDEVNEVADVNQQMIIEFMDSTGTPQRVSVGIDQSKRLTMSPDSVNTIQQFSSLRFNPSNVIGKTGFYVLTMDIGGTQENVRSDFELGYMLDSNAAQSLTPGEQLSFEVSNEAEYNQRLLPDLISANKGLPSGERTEIESRVKRLEDFEKEDERIMIVETAIIPVHKEIITKLKTTYDTIYEDNAEATENLPEFNKNVVYPLLEQIESEEKLLENIENQLKEAKKVHKESRVKLREIISGKNSITAQIRIYNRQLEAPKLNKKDQTILDERRKYFKDNMVILAKNSKGDVVGVVKSFGNSTGFNAISMDHLRNSLFDIYEKSGYTAATSTFKAPVSIVYMGIPNTTSQNGVKNVFEFGDKAGDGVVPASKILDIGYVSYGRLELNSGSSLNTPYNYAQSIMRDVTFTDRKVPVVVFKHNGKDVIYPISLKPNKDSTVVAEEFRNLVERDADSISERLTTINEFLASNNVNTRYRVTPFNFNSDFINEIETEITNSSFFPSIDELLNGGNSKVNLMANAIIDINISDTPFIGPKIKFNINTVPEFISDISSTPVVIEEESELAEKVKENNDKNECKLEFD